jgi:hypothetical protein
VLHVLCASHTHEYANRLFSLLSSLLLALLHSLLATLPHFLLPSLPRLIRVAGILPRNWDRDHDPSTPQPVYPTPIQIMKFMTTAKNLIDLACILPFYVFYLIKAEDAHGTTFNRVVRTFARTCSCLLCSFFYPFLSQQIVCKMRIRFTRMFTGCEI